MSGESLLDLLVRIHDAVGGEGVPALEMAARFGAIEAEYADAVLVRPSAPRLADVVVSRDRETGEASNVEARLAVPGSIRLDEIRAAWGEPQVGPATGVVLTFLAFRPPPAAGARYRAVVSAKTEGDETGPVKWIGAFREALREPPAGAGRRTP